MAANKYDVFISHHKDDTATEAALLTHVLREQGYRVFLDEDTHEEVGDLAVVTLGALVESQLCVVLIGKYFLDRTSQTDDWVTKEVKTALKHSIPLQPVMVATVELDNKMLNPEISPLGEKRFIEYERARVSSLVQDIVRAANLKSRTSIKVLATGILGGFTPIFVAFIFLDSSFVGDIFEAPTIYKGELFVYLAKVIFLMSIGAYWAHKYRQDPKLKKIFQISVSIPALIIIALIAVQLDDFRRPTVEYSVLDESKEQAQPSEPGKADKPTLEDKTSGWNIRFNIISEAQAACPNGTVPNSGGRCVPANSFLNEIRKYVSRPPNYTVTCRQIDLSVSVPPGANVKIREDNAGTLCRVLINGGGDEKASCFDGAGSVSWPTHENWSFKVAESSTSCKIFVR